MVMTIDLPGKAAFVTGAGAGIGRATALAFAQAGAWVLLVDRDERSLDETLATVLQGGGEGAEGAASTIGTVLAVDCGFTAA
jgi:NAD(P)-dependent dehydrogenase (short-subunit alcohol dehydrogenase family)